jgi:DnaJ-class molecular chaperone
MAKNYYVILGVTSHATDNDVRAAYRRLAKAFHPDHYSGGLRAFLDIQEAYSVLSDAQKRRDYDRHFQSRARPSLPVFGKSVTSTSSDPEPLIPGPTPGRLDNISLTRSFQTFTPSFDDIFDRLWSNFRATTRPKGEGMRNLSIEVPVTPEQARQGGQVRILVPSRAYCPTCQGQGALGYYECPRCAGEGSIVGEYPVNIAFPPGLSRNHTVLVSLERFGIQNIYLSVIFRVTARPF